MGPWQTSHALIEPRLRQLCSVCCVVRRLVTQYLSVEMKAPFVWEQELECQHTALRGTQLPSLPWGIGAGLLSHQLPSALNQDLLK